MVFNLEVQPTNIPVQEMILAREIDGGLNLVNHPLVFHLERLRIRLGKIRFLDTMGQLKYDADDQADCPGGKQVEQANHPKRVEECGNHEKQGEKEKFSPKEDEQIQAFGAGEG